jgi:hypothetical protein
MRIFNTIIHQLVQVMINMVSDEGAAKYTARRAACRQGRGLPDCAKSTGRSSCVAVPDQLLA